MRPSSGQFNFISLLPHLILIALQYFYKAFAVVSGSRTTAEAEKTSKIISRIMNDCSVEETYEFKKFLMQVQTRNLNIRNVFFSINWNVLLTVSTFRIVCEYNEKNIMNFRQHQQLWHILLSLVRLTHHQSNDPGMRFVYRIKLIEKGRN